MIVKQLKLGNLNNFCYIIGCEKTREAMVIDPGTDVDRIIKEAKKEGLQIRYIFNTHNHFDHTQGNQPLKQLTEAQIIMHHLDDKTTDNSDIQITNEKTLMLGKITLRIFHTPGHTPGGMCLYGEGQLFTGDTLFVGDSGRTDLPGGHRPTLGASIRKLMKLPDETIIWPGHDYGPTPSSSIGWEKRHNVNAKEYGFEQ